MLDWDAVSTWTILVVEDERDNAEVITGMLHYYGATVRRAENGKVGLEALQDFTPTLILLDLSMPTMDGWEMHQQLKADPEKQKIPVVALSAHAMAGDKERALVVGFDGYLTKPVNVRTLMIDLRRTMEETAALRAAMEMVAPMPAHKNGPEEGAEHSEPPTEQALAQPGSSQQTEQAAK